MKLHRLWLVFQRQFRQVRQRRVFRSATTQRELRWLHGLFSTLGFPWAQHVNQFLTGATIRPVVGDSKEHSLQLSQELCGTIEEPADVLESVIRLKDEKVLVTQDILQFIVMNFPPGILSKNRM